MSVSPANPLISTPRRNPLLLSARSGTNQYFPYIGQDLLIGNHVTRHQSIGARYQAAQLPRLRVGGLNPRRKPASSECPPLRPLHTAASTMALTPGSIDSAVAGGGGSRRSRRIRRNDDTARTLKRRNVRRATFFARSVGDASSFGFSGPLVEGAGTRAPSAGLGFGFERWQRAWHPWGHSRPAGPNRK